MGSALQSHTLTTVGKPVRERISIGHHYNNADERWGGGVGMVIKMEAMSSELIDFICRTDERLGWGVDNF